MNSIPSPALRGLSLRSILPDATPFKTDDLMVRSCCGSWAECQAGDLFVAIVDADTDGHDHVQQAIINGAQGIVTERLLAIDAPQFIVDDTRKALGKICQALAGDPSSLITTIGVGGTDGKTVTSELISRVISVAGGQVTSSTSLWPKGKPFLPPEASSDDSSARIAKWLANSVMDRASHAVLEINAQTIAAQHLHGSAFDILVVTNIRRDESAFERLDQTYQKLQARVLEYLKPQGMAVLNADDPNSQRLLDELQVPALTFGINQAAEISAKIIERTLYDQTFVISAGHESIVVSTQMIGVQHVYNCLAATAVGLILGLELTTIAKGLEAVGQIPGRLEAVHCGQNFNVLIDVATRSTPIATAIHTASQHCGGPLWVLASVDDQISQQEAERLGNILDKIANQVVLAPRSSEVTANFEPFHKVLDGFASQTKVRTMLNRCRGIEWLLQNCPADGTVLILGAGDRPIAQIENGERAITDRDVCIAWLEDRISFCSPPPPGQSMIFNIDDYRKKRR